MNGILYGVSVGPGDPELMTLKAIKTIEACEMIAVPQAGEGEPIALQIARQSVPSIAQKQILSLSMPMTRDQAELERTHAIAAQRVIKLLREGCSVAFLTLGDVSVYATYSYLHRRVIAAGFTARMIAGVPSFCAVAARLGEGLVEGSQPLHIIPASYQGADEGLSWAGTKVLMKTGKSLGAVKEQLRERGLYQRARMVQRCGMQGEQVFSSLDEADETTSYFSIIVVKD